VFFLHDKSEVASILKKFAKKAQNEFEYKIKKIKSDNGKEFDNTNNMSIVMKFGSNM
jgi:IS30 family transposase